MKRDANAILNSELNHVIASLGHTDVLMITDAGFPIPNDAWKVDLALTQGVPELQTVVDAIHDEVIAERVLYADDVPDMNPDLDAYIHERFEGTGTDIETISHEDVLGYGPQAKAIVRTGDFVPWGNIVIECGTDPKTWFSGENTVMPDDYRRRYEEMYGESPE